MKWKYSILLFLLIVVPVSSSFGTGEKLGFKLVTSSIRSMSGSFNDSTAMSDYLDPGMSYGIGIVHQISNYYAVEVNIDIGWMSVKKNQREDFSKEPVFFFPRISFSNIISFFLIKFIHFF